MAIVEFTIHVDDPESVVAIFDRIQVWRSATQNGTYTDITANEDVSAQLDGVNYAPWSITGKALTVIADNATPRTIVFAGTDPISLDDVISQINSIFPGLASESTVTSGVIHLQSPITGTGSVLEISGNASAVLGLINAHINGKAGRLLLSSTTEDYVFRDLDASPTYWYKTRYYNAFTGAVSDYSPPQLGGPGAGLTSSTVVGKIAIVDITGAPIQDRRIILVPTSSQLIDNGSGVFFGILPSVDRIELVTDSFGQASTNLVVGQRLKVFIEGTTFNREFEVPDADFDILSTASTENDPFDIVTVPAMPVRVS